MAGGNQRQRYRRRKPGPRTWGLRCEALEDRRLLAAFPEPLQPAGVLGSIVSAFPLPGTADRLAAVGWVGAGPLLTQAVLSVGPFDDTLSSVDSRSGEVTFQVRDAGHGHPNLVLGDSQTIQIVVRDTNQAPVLAPVGNRTVLALDTLTIALQATDADGDTVTYGAENLPEGAQLNRETGLLTFTPHLFQQGSLLVAVTASDGTATSTESFTIDVLDRNQPPVLVPIPPQSGRENAFLRLEVVVGDVDGDPRTRDPRSPTAGSSAPSATPTWTLELRGRYPGRGAIPGRSCAFSSLWILAEGLTSP